MIKTLAAAAVVVLSYSAGYSSRRIAWRPQALNKELRLIAGLESSWGKFQDHELNSKGLYHTAFGPVGLKASTAHMEYNRSPSLQARFPGLQDPDAFLEAFLSNPELYYACANKHWGWLRKNTSTLEQAVYSWRWGWGAALKVEEVQIAADPYVIKYASLND